jgi:hypothetical protein
MDPKIFKEVPIFWWRAWGTVLMSLLKNLGLAGIALSFCAIAVRYFEERHKKLSRREAWESCRRYFFEKVKTPLTAFLVALLILGVATGPYELYRDSQAEVKQRNHAVATLTAERDTARVALEDRKNNLQTGDAAFDNMLRTFGAFRLLREAVGSECKINISPCQ